MNVCQCKCVMCQLKWNYICISITSLKRDAYTESCCILDTGQKHPTILPQQYWTKGKKGSEKGNRHLMVQAQLRHHLSRQETPVWTRDKALTVTGISACIHESFPMFCILTNPCFFIAETWSGNSFHLKWQSRLRSLLCLLASLLQLQLQQRTCTRLTRIYFVACHATSLFFHPGYPTAGRVLRWDQGFFGVGCCITARSGRS